MVRIIFRQAAIDDLDEIWHYTLNKWSEKQADNYYHDIKLACNQIATKPEIGKRYSQIRDSLQGVKSGRHIIFYQQTLSSEIEVIRILHEQMDLKNWFVK
ncbi:MAG: type II toxin-antitoxin system RelE/ParE family toxin [Bacteroidales bacterium]|nr:type II toxin-antitoxin system RelE/ParE family toxin [Bacteroidales bacterium]